MDSNKVVVHVEQSYGVDVILNCLTEGVRQPSETAHVHTHREILPLNVARANVRRVRIADQVDLFAAGADRRAVSLFGLGITSVYLHELREVDLVAKASGTATKYILWACPLG